MDLTHPYVVLLPRVWGACLLALWRTATPLTGREVARRAGVSQPAALQALKHFAAQGLVKAQPAGRAHLYSLNDEHLAATAVEMIVDMRNALVARIQQSLSHWEFRPDHLSLFGSLARGDGDTQSDIDVLVVRPDFTDESEHSIWRDQLDALANEITQWTGNRAALVEIGRGELASMDHLNSRLLSEARRDGIVVWGDRLGTGLRLRRTRTAAAR